MLKKFKNICNVRLSDSGGYRRDFEMSIGTAGNGDDEEETELVWTCCEKKCKRTVGKNNVSRGSRKKTPREAKENLETKS